NFQKLSEVFFLFSFSDFRAQLSLNPSFFMVPCSRGNRPSLAEWCKDREFTDKLPSLLFLFISFSP
ncbi:hypothetical protein, partial [Sphingobacterium multivorum]|uniref:hypothetical protein n=1 Tax=Sphingobacterium multivorum TaxID=28454 RepID=UPI0028AE8BD8